MEHTIIVRTRDCYPAPRFVAETDYSLRMSRGSVGTGHSFWAAVADAIREARTCSDATTLPTGRIEQRGNAARG